MLFPTRWAAISSRLRLPALSKMEEGRRLHPEVVDGFGGNNASFYEKARPGYPAQALSAIVAEICRSGIIGKGQFLVDLGAGTGKFTRQILPFARAEGTLREVHRVLVPGGLLVLVWNTRDYTRPWVRALEDIIDPFYGDDVPRQQSGQWRKSFNYLKQSSDDGQQRRLFFGELTERHFKHSQLLTPAELADRMRSISVIATRPELERADAVRRAQRLIDTHPDTRQQLRMSGSVELFYDTEVYWCRKV